MREKYAVSKASEYLSTCLLLSIKSAKTVCTKDGIDLLQKSLNEYANDFGIYLNLNLPVDQGILVAYAELRRVVTELNEFNRENNNGRDILTFPLPYVIHHGGIRNITTFPIPEPADRSDSSTSIDNSESHETNSSDYTRYDRSYPNYQTIYYHHDLVDDSCCCNGCIMM